MTTPTPPPLYGYNLEGSDTGHYVLDPAARTSLCGMTLESIPLLDLTPPKYLCWPCKKASRTMPPAVADLDDPEPNRVIHLCPVCGWETAPGPDGKVRAHSEWRQGIDGPHSTGTACKGTGQTPEVQS